MQSILEQMWKGEDVVINTFLLAGVEPKTVVGIVHTKRIMYIRGKQFTVSHGYVSVNDRPVEYEETLYTSLGDPSTDTGTILEHDPAPFRQGQVM